MTLEKACKQLLIKDPFYGLFLMGLNKMFSDKVPTAGVDLNGISVELLINKKFWDELDDNKQLFVLKHELGHICLKHIFNVFKFEDHNIANIAEDMEINGGLDFYEEFYYPQTFDLENNLGSKEYYRILEQEPPKDGGGKMLVDSHDNWGDIQSLPEDVQKVAKEQIDFQVKQAAEQTLKQNGTLPGGLASYLNDLFKPKPRIFNWRKEFRRAIGTMIDIELKLTRKKESVKFPAAPGIKHKKKANILVAIDSSGSVSDNELCCFLAEMVNISKSGAEVTVIEADAAIANTYKFNGKKPNLEIHGRGGTSFDPAINYYNEHSREYTTLVYFTDGYAEVSHLRPRHNNMYWVITANGCVQTYPGKVFYIPKEAE